MVAILVAIISLNSGLAFTVAIMLCKDCCILGRVLRTSSCYVNCSFFLSVQEDHPQCMPFHTCDASLSGYLDEDRLTAANEGARKLTALKETCSEMIALVEENAHLADNALLPLQQSLSQVKQLSLCSQISGKDVLSTNDLFKRPLHITSKRRIGVVDMYHGGKQGKRVSAKKVCKKQESFSQTQEDSDVDAGTTQVHIH